MTAEENIEYPCRTCQRVRDPKNCENKLCREWQAWFIDRWEAMRTAVRQSEPGVCIQSVYVSVGGEKYHHPDAVRRFLKEDPCLHCQRSKGLCQDLCQVKITWDSEKEKIRELESGSQGETSEI